MAFEDRVKAAAAANRTAADEQAAEDLAVEARRAAARVAGEHRLEEALDAVAAVQALPTPPPTPALPQDAHAIHKFTSGEAIATGDDWRVYARYALKKTRPFSSSYNRHFDSWIIGIGHASGGYVTISIAPHDIEVSYRTADLRDTHSGGLTLESFVELGSISWSAGGWKDSSWSAGTIDAAPTLDKFVTAAAALVAESL